MHAIFWSSDFILCSVSCRLTKYFAKLSCARFHYIDSKIFFSFFPSSDLTWCSATYSLTKTFCKLYCTWCHCHYTDFVLALDSVLECRWMLVFMSVWQAEMHIQIHIIQSIQLNNVMNEFNIEDGIDYHKRNSLYYIQSYYT